jgi:ribosomal protein L11 methyltransferase
MNDDGANMSGGWEISLFLDSREATELFEAALEDAADAITLMEQEDGLIFRLVAHCAEMPDRGEIEGRVAVIAAGAGIAPPEMTIAELPQTDWVSAYQNSVGPQTIGRFFVYPSHFKGDTPTGLLPIQLDAGMAFGTGEHGSTRGCLLALDALEASGMRPTEVLDLGCGSAILAIGAALLWPAARIIAADNDPAAVATAEENLLRNGCRARIETLESDFFSALPLQSASPYALIVANILAGPLIDHAGDLVRHMAAGGRLVLAGLLTSQADDVAAAHREYGAEIANRHDLGDWTTLVLEKGNR